jgi:8-oxo-dGTP pyrophosphatase MutT (NUDIX family)
MRDPEIAALREAREESGFEVELIGERPPYHRTGDASVDCAARFGTSTKSPDTHQHIGMIYWARPKSGAMALAPEEHHDIGWFTSEQLDQLNPPMSNAVKWYCRKAIEEIA